MPTEVFETTIELQIGLLEAQMPGPQIDEKNRASYPYPFLVPTDRTQLRAFRALVLENRFLRATVVPALGGRLLELFDKRSGKPVIELPAAVCPVAGGLRGAALREGIQIRYGAHDRLNSLGPVDTMVDQDSTLVLGEISGGGLSFNAFITLPDGRAELRIEVRVFNRTFASLPYDGGLALPFDSGEVTSLEGGAVWHDPVTDVGLAVRSEQAPFDGLSTQQGLFVSRFGHERQLGPRQVDAWTVVLTPVSGLGGISSFGPDAAAHLDDGVLRLQSPETRIGGKAVLLLESGETLEAPVDLYPERTTELDLSGLPARPTALVLMDAHRNELLRFDRAASPDPKPEPGGPETAYEIPQSESDVRRATFDPRFRHAAHVRLAGAALARGEKTAAAQELDQALLFDAEDHLAWWAKAVVARLLGDDAEERAELLNAHFLAPLEPALRAEAFLSQPHSGAKEASAMLRPLAENPESFVEVACLLLELNLFDQATRWIDEALRHTDLAMLRYLQAYAYLAASRMSVEAAEQVAAGSRLPLDPPFPWRDVERRALRALSERFPSDGRLGEWLRLSELHPVS